MRFVLIDDIIQQDDDRIVAVKHVTLAEEYLGDHFPGFPVLPGVMMIEVMVQAARQMLARRGDERLVLGEVKALKFGSFVRPGQALRVEVEIDKVLGDGAVQCRGIGQILLPEHAEPGETAVSGRFIMRPLRVARPTPVPAAVAP